MGACCFLAGVSACAVFVFSASVAAFSFLQVDKLAKIINAATKNNEKGVFISRFLYEKWGIMIRLFKCRSLRLRSLVRVLTYGVWILRAEFGILRGGAVHAAAL